MRVLIGILLVVALGIGLGIAWGNSTPQAKADNGQPAANPPVANQNPPAMNNQTTPDPLAGLSGADRLALLKLQAELDAAKAERAEKAAEAKAEREFRLAQAKIDGDLKLAAIKAETEKTNALVELKAMDEEEAPAPLPPAPDPRVAALETRLAAMETEKTAGGPPIVSDRPPAGGLPYGHVWLRRADGTWTSVRKDAMPNAIHCDEQCALVAPPRPAPRREVRNSTWIMQFIPTINPVQGGRGRGDCMPRAEYPPRRGPCRRR